MKPATIVLITPLAAIGAIGAMLLVTLVPPGALAFLQDGGLGLPTALILLWLAPGITASCRKHHNRAAIWILNILFGWNPIGWLIAVVWAHTNPPPARSCTP